MVEYICMYCGCVAFKNHCEYCGEEWTTREYKKWIKENIKEEYQKDFL